jgi:hypothetical protein
VRDGRAGGGSSGQVVNGVGNGRGWMMWGGNLYTHSLRLLNLLQSSPLTHFWAPQVSWLKVSLFTVLAHLLSSPSLPHAQEQEQEENCKSTQFNSYCLWLQAGRQARRSGRRQQGLLGSLESWTCREEEYKGTTAAEVQRRERRGAV